MRDFINLFGLFASVCMALAQPQVDNGLVMAARKALPHDISTNEIVRALIIGLWNTNNTALAIAIPKPKATVLFVFFRQPGGSYLAVDVSGMEGANIGYLGPDRQYDRVETIPVEWLRREDGLFQVRMRTRAWKGKQRYTASGGGTCVIKPDGSTIWQ